MLGATFTVPSLLPVARGGKVFQVIDTVLGAGLLLPLSTTPVNTLGVEVPPIVPLGTVIGVGTTTIEPLPTVMVLLTVLQLLLLFKRSQTVYVTV